MKTNKSKAAAVLLVIAALFLIYGIYAVINAVNYVNTYTTASTITTMGSIHYIVTSSMAYFGFASILVAASIILKNLTNFTSGSSGKSPESHDVNDPTSKAAPAQSELNVTPPSDVQESAAAISSEHEDDLNVMPATSGEVKYDKKNDDSEIIPAAIAAPVIKQNEELETKPEPAPVKQDFDIPAKSYKYTDTVPLPNSITIQIDRDIARANALLG